MERVGVKELKDHLSAYLARATRGESIVVTDRGRPVARIVPVAETWPEGLAAAMRDGRVTWSGRKPVLPVHLALVKGPGTVADLVVEERR